MFNTYILKSKEFAQPILMHLQFVVHKACPDVEEAMKWSFPHFLYKGKILCSMASFKEHCAFGFWLATEMKDPDDIFLRGKEDVESAMGHLGKIKSMKDLPSDKILIKYIKEAMKLIDADVVLTSKTKAKKAEAVPLPIEFSKALTKNKIANSFFKSISISQQNEYTNWILEAKQESTKERRIVQALEMLAESKTRNWKYEK